MVGSPPSHATINAFTFPTIGNDNTTRAISSIPNMHQNNVMNMQNNHSPWEDPNDSKANDSIPFLPDNEALFLNISLDDPTPQAKGSAQWKWVPSKSAKKKSKGSPSALPTAAIGKKSLWSTHTLLQIHLDHCRIWIAPRPAHLHRQVWSLESAFPYLRSIIHHLTHPLQMVHIRRLEIQIRNNNSCAFRQS